MSKTYPIKPEVSSIPIATHSGKMRIGPLELEVHVLDNKQTVIEAESFFDLMSEDERYKCPICKKTILTSNGEFYCAKKMKEFFKEKKMENVGMACDDCSKELGLI